MWRDIVIGSHHKALGTDNCLLYGISCDTIDGEICFVTFEGNELMRDEIG